MTAPILDIRGLDLSFDMFEGRSHVLRQVALTVGAGQRVALVGESGCGKSVLLRAILGLLDRRKRVMTGEIRFDGTDLVRERESGLRAMRGSRISMIFQDPSSSLNPVFTIADQLTEVILRHGTAKTTQAALALATSALRLVAIDEPEACTGVVSVSALRRHEPARDDHHGADQPPAPCAGRRTRDRVGRNDLGTDAPADAAADH